MTPGGPGPRPSDWLLAWLSARGRASRPTADRACRAIAQRLEPSLVDARPPTRAYAAPLVRLGHAEWVGSGLAAVPPALCWTGRPGRGIFLGARDAPLREDLGRRLGSRFSASSPGGAWPSTWAVAGGDDEVSRDVAGLGVAVLREPGPGLLASLPALEEAISAWPDDGRPPALCSWEILADPGRGRWVAADGILVGDAALVQTVGRGRRGWMVVRGGLARWLDSSERRAVGWWAELARLGGGRLILRREAGRLALPASRLHPPTMVERPLIWASGEPPGRAPGGGLVYEAIDPGRAGEVARILGLPLEEVP